MVRIRNMTEKMEDERDRCRKGPRQTGALSKKDC